MLYITKVVLNKKSIYFGYVAFDCEESHRLIMSLFPHIQTSEARVDGRVLYTFAPESDNAVIYIQSAIAPQDPGTPQTTSLITSMKTVDAKNLLSSFADGKEFGFTVLANPSTKVFNPDNGKSRRVFLRDKGKRENWLGRHMAGCSIQECHESRQIKVSGFKSTNDHVRLDALEFGGKLKISDRDRFTETFLSGIGQGKSYGCGMIMLYPPRG